jgi:O-glycosyl hydrolase
VDLDSSRQHPPILGTGFNFEHALWSCPEFRGLFQQDILDPFRPALARVDTGLLPAAPPDVPAAQLGRQVYASVLASAPYSDSWAFLKRLNRAGVRIVLGVWGGPQQFTADGTRLGKLEPSHYDDYVEYVASLIEFLVQERRIQVWATTIANEPDGGDGNQIPPAGLAYIAHQLAERVAPLGVGLYGPDTASGASTMQYLPLLMDDPTVAKSLAFVGFHEYYASPDVARVVDYVRARKPDLPVVVTEYTSFGFGDLDAGQEVNDGVGFTLDIAATLLSHYRSGVDAALYWDAVDYLQPGHEAITRWGLLRGPQRDFAPRRRYYGLLQILPYLQPGTRLLNSVREGDDPDLSYLAVLTPSGAPAVFLVNQGVDEIVLTLDLAGSGVTKFPAFAVRRTDRDHNAEGLGRLRLQDGNGSLTLPPRSLTTLFPVGAAVDPSESAS